MTDAQFDRLIAAIADVQAEIAALRIQLRPAPVKADASFDWRDVGKASPFGSLTPAMLRALKDIYRKPNA